MDRSILLFIGAISAIVLFLLWRALLSSRYDVVKQNDIEKEKSDTGDPYEDIEPLHDFDWTSTEPMQIRPFKPKFHLTMALENCPLHEFLAIDKTYLDRVKLRQQVMDDHKAEIYRCNAACEPAVMETYEWIFSTYLPKRFPSMYKLVDSSQIPGDSKVASPCLRNIPTGEYIPLQASSPEKALYTLGKNVDTDILILLPSSKAEDGSPIYHLEAFVCCFPSGFSTPKKLSLPLASIHEPVPGYESKMKKSMDRYFAKLEVGKAVRRFNWSITTNTKLYSQEGNHLYSDGSTQSHGTVGSGPAKNEKTLDVNSNNVEDVIEEQKKDVNIENCRLRCERQTLHRLPKTKALVFAFKTYQYGLADVKAEGNGPALAEAITGLGLGNSPDMLYYKRGVVWGDKVREYLLS